MVVIKEPGTVFWCSEDRNVCFTYAKIEIGVLPVLDELLQLLYGGEQVDLESIQFKYGLAYVEAKLVEKALEWLKLTEILVLESISVDGVEVFDVVTVIYEYSKSGGHDRIVITSAATGKHLEYQDSYPEWMRELTDLPKLTGLDIPKP